jgi:hypothetical protein
MTMSVEVDRQIRAVWLQDPVYGANVHHSLNEHL